MEQIQRELVGKKVFGDAPQKQKPFLLYLIFVSSDIHFKQNLYNFQGNANIIYTREVFYIQESTVLNGKSIEKEVRNS